MVQQTASLLVAPNKGKIPTLLNTKVAKCCVEAIQSRNVFTIALSGGSLPKFLGSIDATFQALGILPNYEQWHVILADERCVKTDHPDSNLGSLKTNFLDHVSIPSEQIYPIDESKIGDADAVASSYNSVVKNVLEKSGGRLDLAVLGFGPDGHTCSLFPGHALLKETEKTVAPIEDSPKPPPQRITLTFPVLNASRNVIFCGAGSSKSPILKAAFVSIDGSTVTLSDPAPYPCAMVRPTDGSLTWVVDTDAMEGVSPST